MGKDNFLDTFLRNWQVRHGINLSLEGRIHFRRILSIIYDKMFDPEKPESKFVTLCFEENWDYAKIVADTRNREGFQYNLFQDFLDAIKKYPVYIQNNRDRKLNKIIKLS